MSQPLIFLLIFVVSYIIAEIIYEIKVKGRIKISELVTYNTELPKYIYINIKSKGLIALIDPIVMLLLLHYLCMSYIIILILIK